MNRGFLTLLLVLIFNFLCAQQAFKYRANLPQVDSAGFYKIALLPSLIAKCQPDLADIRINDANGKTVTFIFGDQLPIDAKKDFVTFPQTKYKPQTDTASIFIAENVNRFAINSLAITIRNTAVSRTINLSGSDDLKHWYAIKENIELATPNAAHNATYQQSFDIPFSNYRYFKIDVNHKNKDGIAIVNVGIDKKQIIHSPTYTPIEGSSFSQKDSDKISYITVKFDEAYQINQLKLQIAGAKYYKRKVRIYQVNNGEESLVNETEITSLSAPLLNLSAKTKVIKIQILNDDNPAIIVQSVKALQLNKWLICYLEKSQQYHLLFGDSTAVAPQYDLNAFTDSLHQQLPVIAYTGIIANPAHLVTASKPPFTIPQWAIWVAIVLVVGVLALLTFKMTAEVNKRSV
ncbi:hypothetical protein [Mucilaginibacter gracilis]|nr:hypothetical protein [Mucilaginibacter gracilis]